MQHGIAMVRVDRYLQGFLQHTHAQEKVHYCAPLIRHDRILRPVGVTEPAIEDPLYNCGYCMNVVVPKTIGVLFQNVSICSGCYNYPGILLSLEFIGWRPGCSLNRLIELHGVDGTTCRWKNNMDTSPVVLRALLYSGWNCQGDPYDPPLDYPLSVEFHVSSDTEASLLVHHGTSSSGRWCAFKNERVTHEHCLSFPSAPNDYGIDDCFDDCPPREAIVCHGGTGDVTF